MSSPGLFVGFPEESFQPKSTLCAQGGSWTMDGWTMLLQVIKKAPRVAEAHVHENQAAASSTYRQKGVKVGLT